MCVTRPRLVTDHDVPYYTLQGLRSERYVGERRADTSQATTNFGLINRTYDTDADYDPQYEKTQWQRFEHKVFRLNRESGRNVQYKVLYMGRHGEGYHNVAEAFYGTPAWNVSLACRNSDGLETQGREILLMISKVLLVRIRW